MELFNEKIISEFKEWKDYNKEKFTWWSYVNMKADIQIALGFAKFFYPEVIIKDNCFLLKDHYETKVYDEWRKSYKGNKKEIEKIMNFYEVNDFFHMNSNYKDPYFSEQIDALAKAIKLFWSFSFKERFPDKNIVVKIFRDFDTKCVTVYEKV